MIKKLHFFTVRTSNCSPLADLDDIYANAIWQLPITTRREYCLRLIKRMKFDLKTATCKKKKRQLIEMIESATSEISKLEQPKSKI